MMVPTRLLIGIGALIAFVVGLHFYGEGKVREGRALMAAEIAAAAAEKRQADAETLEEIGDEIANTPDDELVDIIIDGGWLLPDD